ncbi:NADP-dependent oxidoreductase domain-containing protein [Pseudomassariella vexata]|uniref:NADP-dependent oxidoreductase domain-containing protein n=1 Tax=Pseudomassariella vexata TaxID=1141098 RepID=A0A1Y2DVM9_9PEZI|nr:NADP-dependent oxidoreductase domain-containing protein [Pseudomassariella vexata]ORY63308.1 NADP-dependent oxidoreductase domain-containing protein [Pseudomassariella vexata]
MSTAPVSLTWGCASVHSDGAFSTTSAVQELLSTLQDLKITHLDSAQLYGDCEVLLGQAGVTKYNSFVIDSKTPGGFVPGSLAPEKLEADFHATLKNLGIAKLGTFFLHASDPTTPIEPALEKLDALYREGYFARLGLSNMKADEVAAVHKLCTERGWVAPSVYQGNYSAFARRQETELLPTLRKLGISFSAYSPLAGGFLARRSADELTAPGTGGRFAIDPADPEGKKGGLGLYRQLYSSRPKLVEALADWGRIADAAGCSCPAELAFRWVVWNSALMPENGDCVTLGARSIEQLRKTVGWVSKGRLEAETAAKINALWEDIKSVAPLDNKHM